MHELLKAPSAAGALALLSFQSVRRLQVRPGRLSLLQGLLALKYCAICNTLHALQAVWFKSCMHLHVQAHGASSRAGSLCCACPGSLVQTVHSQVHRLVCRCALHGCREG